MDTFYEQGCVMVQLLDLGYLKLEFFIFRLILDLLFKGLNDFV